MCFIGVQEGDTLGVGHGTGSVEETLHDQFVVMAWPGDNTAVIAGSGIAVLEQCPDHNV